MCRLHSRRRKSASGSVGTAALVRRARRVDVGQVVRTLHNVRCAPPASTEPGPGAALSQGLRRARAGAAT